MPLSRRALLRAIGSTTIVAVAGGPILAYAADPIAPWAEPGRLPSDPRIKALEWAVLVPNPHNRQPWLVELVGENELRLFCDLDRRLPMTDPFDRQITIGLGCFLEMFTLAATAGGHRATTTLFPDGAPGDAERLDGRPVAHITLAPTSDPADPLFKAAPYRRTNKAVYDARVPAADDLARLPGAARGTTITTITDADAVAAITAIAYRAGELEFTIDRTRRESIDLMRIGQREIAANPDGIDIGGPVVEELAAAGILTREAMDDVTSPAFQQGAAMYAEPLVATTGWIAQTSAANSRGDQITTGRDWLRVNLAATATGLSVHPYSQALQEFPEMAPHFSAIHDRLGVAAPARLQMLARVGYGPAQPPSPRWPAASRVLGG